MKEVPAEILNPAFTEKSWTAVFADLVKARLTTLVLLTLQIVLGAATIWLNKAADIATGHVMVGALALLAGALWWLVAARRTTLT